ncbi:hypothetical protein JW916_05715 [Candidatus Sumerlaeota bacterium]|nr:hypothetical protein [Candidatus Sumerlaeota bacterium]
MLTPQKRRTLAILTLLIAVACLVYGAQRRITVLNGRAAGSISVDVDSRSSDEVGPEVEPATLPSTSSEPGAEESAAAAGAIDDMDVFEMEFPPLEDLPPETDEATKAEPSAGTDEIPLSATPDSSAQSTGPPVEKVQRWRGVAVGDRLPWVADESNRVEIADPRMVEYATYSGLIRTEGSLHLSHDATQGPVAGGKKACPT